MMNTYRRWISLFLCVTAVSVSAETVFSVHPDHECTGAGCPVCLLIQYGEMSFRYLKSGVVHSGFQAVSLLMAAFVLKRGFLFFIPLNSVQLKVRINT